jgi:hypothetical protein
MDVARTNLVLSVWLHFWNQVSIYTVLWFRRDDPCQDEHEWLWQVVPILRAGLVLVEHAGSVLPANQTYHVGNNNIPSNYCMRALKSLSMHSKWASFARWWWQVICVVAREATEGIAQSYVKYGNMGFLDWYRICARWDNTSTFYVPE